MLSTVERRVFYFCSLFLYFFKLVFKHSGISIKQEEHSQTQPLKRSLDKRVGGILMPDKARAFLYLTYLLFFYFKCYCYFYHTKNEAETLEEEHQCLPRKSSLSRIAKVLWWKCIIKIPEIGFVWLNIDIYNMQFVIS